MKAQPYSPVREGVPRENLSYLTPQPKHQEASRGIFQIGSEATEHLPWAPPRPFYQGSSCQPPRIRQVKRQQSKSFIENQRTPYIFRQFNQNQSLTENKKGHHRANTYERGVMRVRTKSSQKERGENQGNVENAFTPQQLDRLTANLYQHYRESSTSKPQNRILQENIDQIDDYLMQLRASSKPNCKKRAIPQNQYKTSNSKPPKHLHYY